VRGELADHLGLLFPGQAHDRETVARSGPSASEVT
jgi:hypothetical protein